MGLHVAVEDQPMSPSPSPLKVYIIYQTSSRTSHATVYSMSSVMSPPPPPLPRAAPRRAASPLQHHAYIFIAGVSFRLSDDHHAKSHSLDSAPAYFLVLVRLALLGVFLVGAVKTFEAEQNSVRRGFIGRLVVLGSLWFATVPVLVLVAMVCAEYVQEPVGEGVLEAYLFA